MKWSDKEILHCDNHLLVAIKRAGQLVQPDLHEEMRLFVQRQFDKKGRAFLEPLHRLDKPVSGLVLFARTSKALERLNKAMREQRVHKTYRARVEGWVEQTEGQLDHFLIHREFFAEVVGAQSAEAKRALLTYKVVERDRESSLLEIELQTGRYHQIRAQLAHIGHPIIGDAKYGSRSAASQIALQNVTLAFVHPVTQEPLTFHYAPIDLLRISSRTQVKPIAAVKMVR